MSLAHTACGVNPLRRLRSRVAPATKTALMRLGAYTSLRRLLPSRQVAILRYHAICGSEGDPYADPHICISPPAFEDHIRYLAAHYAVLRLEDVAVRLRDGRALPPNTVVITFDDGYADNLAAARVLHRFGVSATFFITADCLAGGEPFWPAEIRTLIPAVNAPSVRLTAGTTDVEIPLRTSQERLAAVRKVTTLFKSHPIPAREAFREQLRAAAGRPAMPRCMLTWSELAEMHRLGMTIGAHTLTHPNLPSAGLEAASREIAGSKTRLQAELGTEISLFSYPNGGADRYYTPELQRMVADSGYVAAASSKNAFATVASDWYALERVEVEERLEDLVFALEVERFAFRPAATSTHS